MMTDSDVISEQWGLVNGELGYTDIFDTRADAELVQELGQELVRIVTYRVDQDVEIEGLYLGTLHQLTGAYRSRAAKPRVLAAAEKAANPAFFAHRNGLAHTDCWCARCEAEAKKLLYLQGKIDWTELPPSFMHLCPDCGNKRCPRASDHMKACTGSNELGQPEAATE